MPPGELDERILSLIAERNHPEAATVAIRGYGPRVLRYLHSILGDPEEAREAFAQFAENLWRGLPGFRTDGPFQAWAYRIAWNVACDMRKSGWQRRRRLSTTAAMQLADTIGTSSNARVEKRRQALDELRASLSMEDRALAALRIDQGLSWEECAEALSTADDAVKPNTVAKRFERIKERLGRLARKRGLLAP